jgi:hypothetical protein
VAAAAAVVALAVTGCGGLVSGASPRATGSASPYATRSVRATGSARATLPTRAVRTAGPAGPARPAPLPHQPTVPCADCTAGGPLPAPARLGPFGGSGYTGEGAWHPAGRLVHGVPAVYETTLVPPGGSAPSGIAWLDTRLLSARLYSGSASPGGGRYKYTAPVQPAQAASLVAAFNGGFKMRDAHGGYYTEGHVVVPLVRGAASLVIYANGDLTIGAWGSDVSWSPSVVAVRQNLVPLVADGRPTPLAGSDWRAWGSTCGAHSCAATVPGIEHQWRSGAGVTADGALVYAAGPGLSPWQLASLLARAGVRRGLELDINPAWPDFASYAPAHPGGLASPSNGGKLLASMNQGPLTFFRPSWARDFITMSAR